MKVDLTKVYNKYKGLWVALDSSMRNVIAADKDATKVHNQALKKGYEKPILFKVPRQNLPYFGPFSSK